VVVALVVVVALLLVVVALLLVVVVALLLVVVALLLVVVALLVAVGEAAAAAAVAVLLAAAAAPVPKPLRALSWRLTRAVQFAMACTSVKEIGRPSGLHACMCVCVCVCVCARARMCVLAAPLFCDITLLQFQIASHNASHCHTHAGRQASIPTLPYEPTPWYGWLWVTLLAPPVPSGVVVARAHLTNATQRDTTQQLKHNATQHSAAQLRADASCCSY
jgi:hypothetical protein